MIGEDDVETLDDAELEDEDDEAAEKNSPDEGRNHGSSEGQVRKDFFLVIHFQSLNCFLSFCHVRHSGGDTDVLKKQTCT